MNKRQLSVKETSEARSGFGKKRLSAHVGVLVLLVALLLPILESVASAQSCIEMCQVALSQCMQGSQGDPVVEVNCQDQYDKCGDACM